MKAKPPLSKTAKNTQTGRKLAITGARCLICIGAASMALLAYIDKQNELTELRLAIPMLAKDVKALQEENIALKYEVDRFESPIHLMELMRKPEFSHLKFPYVKDEIFIEKTP